MAKSLSVLFVSSEVYPYSKESSIADYSYSLSLALRELGNDVRVMMPKYGAISERKNKIHDINRLKDVPIPIGDTTDPATIKSSSINNVRQKVQAYITTNFKYFDSRKGVYHDPTTWEEYEDNAERFIYFNRSVVETCILLGWFPDIIHCNDWHTALVPIYAKMMYPKLFKKTKFVFTFHNFNRQGIYPATTFKLTGLPKSEEKNLIHKKQFNFLKAGLTYADYITTLSPTYAEDVFDMKDKDYGNGLQSILKDKKDVFKGIPVGIDFWLWNAEKDDLIKAKYSGNFEEYKYHNKVALTQNFNLEYKPRTPLIAMINKIEADKGVQQLIESADKIFKEDVQIVLLGQGDAKLKQKLMDISNKYPEKFQVKFVFDDELAHLMEAGSDAFLIASDYEPSALKFLYSCRYGTIPIARVSGGLKEFVEPLNLETGEGNAFIMDNFDSKSMIKAVKEAIELFKDKEKWEQFAQNCFEVDSSWTGKSIQYNEIYKKLNKEVQTK